ncbi:uncharacterized protein LOC114356583 [Ostrinia furnacalis]|uniref:uncharacterized protein LOC114356583 n=1 Tax=Ostrinia furnacalis TaxID=93504 RepID=UPI00103D9396|nr:uncharacterized protein LOC114356583 [Ostrinia furnacalis]
MGCTSSAPNMTTTNHNATEKIIEFSDEGELPIKDDVNVISTDEENGKNEIKVLPCDTLADPIQLDSNNKSIIDTSKLDMDEDIPTNGEGVIDNETEAKENENFETEQKLSSLEDVVEKVVELHAANILEKRTQEVPEIPAETDVTIVENTNVEEFNKTPERIVECESEPSDQPLKEEPPEGESSPSQSTSSRATRWEALADIAAELPPSLTVDPLTGQIYALSK